MSGYCGQHVGKARRTCGAHPGPTRATSEAAGGRALATPGLTWVKRSQVVGQTRRRSGRTMALRAASMAMAPGRHGPAVGQCGHNLGRMRAERGQAVGVARAGSAARVGRCRGRCGVDQRQLAPLSQQDRGEAPASSGYDPGRPGSTGSPAWVRHGSKLGNSLPPGAEPFLQPFRICM